MKVSHIKNHILSKVLLLGLVTVLALPAVANAESNTLALACTGENNSLKISGNKVSCTKKGTTPSVQGVGTKEQAQQDQHPYPDSVELTLVKLDCGKNAAKTPKLGAAVTSLSCAKGTAKVSKTGTIAKASTPTIGTYNPDGSGGKYLSSGDACGNVNCKDSAADPQTPCNKENGCDIIGRYVNPIINLLTFVFGLIAIISIIVGGIQYSASGGEPQKVAEAKKRIINTILAIVSYFFLYALMQFLIPGGLFG